MSQDRTLFIDGEPASLRALAHQALVNYGAYTSFRVENGGVRGLDHHLERLRLSALALFGEAVPEERLRAFMRSAMGEREACWLRVSLFSREIWTRDPTWSGVPSVMVGVFDAPSALAEAVRLQVQTHERTLPHLKHAASMDLLLARRQARAAGFDDTLFADREGRVTEGTLWNIGFLSGEMVIWPSAPMLAGTTQAVLAAGLEESGLRSETRVVTLDEIAGFDGAFICNSATPACPVTAIDGLVLAPAHDRIAALAEVWDAAPPQPI